MEIQHYHYASIDSTQSVAKNLIAEFDRKKMTVITADEQTSGKGRLNRSWVSPKGKNIYASFVVFSPLTPHLVNAAQAGCLATSDVLKACGVSHYGIKWPNDLLVDSCKIAGILVDCIPFKNEVCVITGIGFNVLSTPEDWAGIAQPVTSLLQATGNTWIINDVLKLLEKQMCIRLQELLEKGFPTFAKEYNSLLVHKKGDPFSLDKAKGTFLGISHRGALLLQLASGEVKEFF